ncbi:uncharacterized protein KRP23_1582 [Phytophthora ramorum]|uniref:uncharacterized protein n=1 Tax=Phytophthora ramorum TaxID=164328 RepID=UPI0030950B84|nr:hypothetical protein KRP23_1582 [Phytophthora ramorum]
MEHDASSLLHRSMWQVALTATSLGIVHVLSGPDHLGALVALSNGKTWRQAFVLGAQWGCGHSLGILAVALICVFVVGHALAPNGSFSAACKYLTVFVSCCLESGRCSVLTRTTMRPKSLLVLGIWPRRLHLSGVKCSAKTPPTFCCKHRAIQVRKCRSRQRQQPA